ncbi:MAG: ribosome silencing factor [Candidatus Latescibacteria bacterium]|nr:ribosome silencing factor [Candidatus Latescibacterota bacterium]
MILEKNNDTEHCVENIIKYIVDKKGEDIAVLDLRGVSSVSDFFILTTGTSNVHLKAIADEIREKLKKDANIIPWHLEGIEALKWVLLDYVDIVVHIFDKETRAYYSLEKLWEDAHVRHVEINN